MWDDCFAARPTVITLVSKTSHMEKNYTDKEEEYINKLMTDGMERKEAEHFLDIMQAVAPGDFNKGLGCIRKAPRWMKSR